MAKVYGASKEMVQAFRWKDGESVDSYIKRTDAEYKKLRDAADALPKGKVVGALLRFPVADGYAAYRVVKEKPLEIEHIPYGDAWNANAILLRGLRLDDVKKMIESERALNAMFRRKR